MCVFPYMSVWSVSPVRGLEGQVFSLWAKQLFGMSTHHAVNKHEQNKLWRLKNVVLMRTGSGV